MPAYHIAFYADSGPPIPAFARAVRGAYNALAEANAGRIFILPVQRKPGCFVFDFEAQEPMVTQMHAAVIQCLCEADSLFPTASIALSLRGPPLYPSPEFGNVLERFRADAAPVALEMLEAVCQRSARSFPLSANILLRYSRMIAPLEIGYFFMRTYLEKALAFTQGDVEANRQRFERAYAKLREESDVWVTRALAGKTPVPAHCDAVDSWFAQLTQLRQALEVLHRDGTKIKWSGDDIGALRGQRAGGVPERSGFVRTIGANHRLWQQMDEGGVQQVHAALATELHQLLGLLRLDHRARMLIFYALARSIETKCGIDPLRRAAEV